MVNNLYFKGGLSRSGGFLDKIYDFNIFAKEIDNYH